MFCENCGAKIDADAYACAECGHVIKPFPDSNTNQNIGQKNENRARILPKGIIRKIAFAGGGLVALIAIFFFVTNVIGLGGAGKDGHLVYYSKDGLYGLTKGSKDPYLISEDYINGSSVYITKDKTKIFFADSRKGDDTSFDIYMRELNGKKPSGKDADEKGIKVASNVEAVMYEYFTVIEEGKNIYLLYNKEYRDGQSKLYYSDLKEEEKIDNGILDYRCENGLLYYKKYDENYDESVLYSYPLNGKGDKKKIDTGYIVDLYATKDGDFYYIKGSEDNMRLSELVNDDMLDEDMDIYEPDMYNFQKEEYVDGWFGGYYSTVTDYEAYYEAYDKYREKSQRDYIREELGELYALSGYQLGIYKVKNGEKSLVSDNISYSQSIEGGDGVLGLFYKKANLDIRGPLVNLSEISSAYDVYSYIEDSITLDNCVLLQGNLSVVKIDEEVEPNNLNIFGNTIVFTDGYESEIYIGKISGGKVDKFEILDYDTYFFHEAGDSFCYYKESVRDLYDVYLYEGGKSGKIASDVGIGTVMFSPTGSDYTYIADMNNYYGTAYLMKNGKNKTKLGDDVTGTFHLGSEIYFTQNYSTKRGTYELYRFVKEGKTQLVTQDVYYIVNQ